MLCAAGGRCELLWPEDASSVLLFDEGVCDLGEPSRDEPMVTFRKVTRSRLLLTPEDRVALMGGAVLWGDPEDKSGPFLVERARDDILRVTNQSKRACTVAFRDEELVLSPGESMELPLLEAGGAPIVRDPTEARLAAGGREVRVTGEVLPTANGLEALSDATVQDLGVTIDLRAGESVILDVFGRGPTDPELTEPEPEPVPEPPGPETGPVPDPEVQEQPEEPAQDDPADDPAEGAGDDPIEDPIEDPADDPTQDPAEDPTEDPRAKR